MEQESSLNIFENTNYNFNRVTNQSLVIDVECGTNVDFSVNLQEPLIIDKLMDKQYTDLPVKQLFLDQIKFKHEKVIGEMLAGQYINPKIN